MILSVAVLSDEAQLGELREQIDTLKWRDGRGTAGGTARTVKFNRQADLGSGAGARVRQTLHDLIARHSVVKASARPRRFSPLMVSKTSEGGFYGPHVDNALLGQREAPMRSDISFTLFLTPPEHYDGGELVIHAAGMTHSVKGEAGELVLYPASSIHEVRCVTRGERIVCVGWIESVIADGAQRELLFDLENLRASLRDRIAPTSPELLTLDRTIGNLLRMWARP